MRPDFGSRHPGVRVRADLDDHVDAAADEGRGRARPVGAADQRSSASRSHFPNRSSSQVNISVDYRVRATNTFYNLVYPFYLEEGDRG